jgi:hypothetical protein
MPMPKQRRHAMPDGEKRHAILLRHGTYCYHHMPVHHSPLPNLRLADPLLS